jgi:ribonuclease P protein component
VSTRFQRKERLKSRKTIGRLFKEKQSVGSFPLRFFFLKSIEEDDNFALQSAFSVSKKHFKKAVDRNRIKRLMRESLRLNKENLILFLNEKGIKIAGMWVFVGSEIIDFQQMESAVVKTIDKLIRLLNEQQS